MPCTNRSKATCQSTIQNRRQNLHVHVSERIRFASRYTGPSVTERREQFQEPNDANFTATNKKLTAEKLSNKFDNELIYDKPYESTSSKTLPGGSISYYDKPHVLSSFQTLPGRSVPKDFKSSAARASRIPWITTYEQPTLDKTVGQSGNCRFYDKYLIARADLMLLNVLTVRPRVYTPGLE